jgi:hypothetical protein
MTLMKTYIKLFVLLLLVATACDDDETKVVDPIHEFIAFKGPSTIDVSENANSEEGYPLYVELKAFKPYSQDIDVSLQIVGHNTVKDVDFIVTPSESVKIRAGSLVSDPIWIKTIDNESGSVGERTFDIKIGSVSNSDVNIGLGFKEPKNSFVTVKIQDDECGGSPLCVYNVALSNEIGGGTTKPVAVVLDKDNSKITLTGDLIDYSAFPNATITLIFTPASEGASTGTVSLVDQEAGTDNDGYLYKFVELSPGTYDADAGTISIEYEIFYEDGGDWVSWYTVTNVFSVP